MADRPAGNFGRKLREARERRGISLRQIANATKIGVTALEALERNDISRLPGGIFSRAFVRSYALEVGLDPEVTIQEFIEQFPSDSVTAGHPTSLQSEDHQAIDSDRRAATTFVRLIAVSIPIAGAVLYLGTAGRRPTAPPAPAAALLAPVESVSSPVEALSPPSEAPAPAPSTAPPPPSADPAALPRAAPLEANSDRLTVGLSAVGECWVSATVDGEEKVERLLQPGEQWAIDVHHELVLTAGDASALAMTLNGAEARPLGKPGEVVTARLNLTNFRDYVANR
jgi:cytoskeletal protein RodZ